MASYVDVKSRKIKRLLKWLVNNTGVEVGSASGKHTKVTCIHNGRSFPLPLSHRVVNRYIVEAFGKWLVDNEVCSKEEFDEKL